MSIKTSDMFEVRPVAQREWNILILLAFFFGAVGTGLFLVSAFFNFTFGVVLSLLIVAICMGYPHLIYLGRPLRFWRMLTSWSAFRRSWLTRGMWGWVLFMVFGVLYALSLGEFTWLPWTSQSMAGRVMLGIAAVASIWGMIYVGFVMAQSPAIAFWNTPILPVLFLIYGFIDGIDLTLVLLAARGETLAVNIELLGQVELLLVILTIVFLWAYLSLMSSSRLGAREAVRRLIKGELAFIFWGVVVVTGLVIPLVVGIYSFMVGVPLIITGLVGLLALIGAVYFKYVILRSGFYEKPI